MKKALIAIMLVVFLLTVMVPAVFAAPASPPPNDNQDCYGESTSIFAQTGDMGSFRSMLHRLSDVGASLTVHCLQSCRQP